MVSILTILLFVGQYYDHHGDRTLFIKHRPTFKQIFKLNLFDQPRSTKLTVEQQLEEAENEEFVFKGKLKESHGNITLPAILIQISIMLLVSATFSFVKKVTISWLHLFAQFIVNISITIFLVFYMLWSDNFEAALICFGVLTVTNFLTILLFDRLDKNSDKHINKSKNSLYPSSS